MKVALNRHKQVGSGSGKRNLSRCAVKKANAQLILQLLYKNTQPRRGDEQLAGSAREAAMLRDQQKATELARRKVNH
jgi:hypothetical protein